MWRQMTNTIQKATQSPGSVSRSQHSSTKRESRSPTSRLPNNASMTGCMELARPVVSRSQSSAWMHCRPRRSASAAPGELRRRVGPVGVFVGERAAAPNFLGPARRSGSCVVPHQKPARRGWSGWARQRCDSRFSFWNRVGAECDGAVGSKCFQPSLSGRRRNSFMPGNWLGNHGRAGNQVSYR